MPSSAGSETVYAAKGLDRPINAGESVEDFADYKENKKIAHVYLTLTVSKTDFGFSFICAIMLYVNMPTLMVCI